MQRMSQTLAVLFHFQPWHTSSALECMCIWSTYREVAGIMALPSVGDIAAHRKAGSAIRLVALQNRIAPHDRHVVNNPLVHVGLMDMVF